MAFVVINESKKIFSIEATTDISLSQLLKNLNSVSINDECIIYILRILDSIVNRFNPENNCLPYVKRFMENKNFSIATLARSIVFKSENKTTPYININNQYGIAQKINLEKHKVHFVNMKEQLGTNVKCLVSCSFCQKYFTLTDEYKYLKFTNNIYCKNCFRNKYYHKYFSKNILLLSYKAVFGYYYHCFVKAPKYSNMQLSSLREIIDKHVKAGMTNQLFNYDPDNFLWIIDLNYNPKFEDIFKTIVLQVYSLELYNHLPDFSSASYLLRFKKAVQEFIETKSRPKDCKILCPTLYGCNNIAYTNNTNQISVEELRNFTNNMMVEPKRKY